MQYVPTWPLPDDKPHPGPKPGYIPIYYIPEV